MNEQKTEALERMKALQIMGQVRNHFRHKNKVYYSERQNKVFNAVLYELDGNNQLQQIVNEFQSKHPNCLVYHCQLTHTYDGDLFTMLYVSDESEYYNRERRDLYINGQVLAYVANIGENGEKLFGEFGYVQIRPSMGGVLRVA